MKILPLNTININYIPQKSLLKLNSREINILKNLLFIMQQSAKKGHGRDYACQASEKWLAKRCKTSIWQISRSIQKMVRLGIISAKQQITKYGQFKTNLYGLGKVLIEHIWNILKGKSTRDHNRLQISANLEEIDLDEGKERQKFFEFVRNLTTKVGKGVRKRTLEHG